MRKKIGECGVDSGQILLIDPCYVYKDEYGSGGNYDECCQITKSGDKAGQTTLGVVTSTYSGDGVYPVYATTDEYGAIMSVEIVFKESEEQTTREDVQIYIETDEEYGRRVSQILENEEQ